MKPRPLVGLPFISMFQLNKYLAAYYWLIKRLLSDKFNSAFLNDKC